MRELPEPYDEARGSDGRPREGYVDLLPALAQLDLRALRAAVAAEIAEQGASFGDGGAFEVCPVPRVIGAQAWAALAAGLEQRVRALNAFVRDAYGSRRIVSAGVLDDETIDSAEGYEPLLRGRLPRRSPPVAIAGLDVVVDEHGRALVLEDNCRAPSGLRYAVAARRATAAALPVAGSPYRAIEAPAAELLGATLRDAAPEGVAEPSIVVLTDGPHNSAYWEHAQTARVLGIGLVTLADLERHAGELRLADGGGRVDVLYRRCDEDRLREDDGRPTEVAALVLEPWLSGRLGIVNAFGTGVADDKRTHAHVEAMIRFYLGEEPALASVPTLDLRDPEALATVLADLRGFVVKPRGGFGGHGVVVAAHCTPEDLEALRTELGTDPSSFVAQRTVTLSSHPTVVGGHLVDRHIDLRPFIFAGRDWTRTLPGGLTRVAMDPGALVVNSSQAGGGKDTRVLR